MADVRAELEATGIIFQSDRHLGLDGKWRKVKRKTAPPAELQARKPAAVSPLDSKQAKALVAIRASGEAGMAQQEAGGGIRQVDRQLGADGRTRAPAVAGLPQTPHQRTGHPMTRTTGRLAGA